jgi:hypothetical protein
MDYVTLYPRGDRLGANITLFLSVIFFAIENKYLIKLQTKVPYRYNNSIFFKSLIFYIEQYNKSFNNFTYKTEIEITQDFRLRMYETQIAIKSDFISYFKQNLSPLIEDKYNFFAKENNYKLPFDPETTILIHLRLDDKQYARDYDSSISANYYKNSIDNNKHIYTEKKPPNFVDCQSSISEDKIMHIMNDLKKEFPKYKVYVVTSKISKHSLPYETISNNDQNYDLYLLSKCKILIGSRSSFCYTAMIFGNHARIYYPLWGVGVLWGITTKYDKTSNIITF